MSRQANPNPTNPFAAPAPNADPGELTPIDGQSGDQAPSGGVFRLEAMAPGVENAEQAMSTARKRKVSTQAIALGTLLVVGGGGIYGMRLLGIGPLTTLAKFTAPEYDLSRPGSAGADQKKILQDLAANHAASQVPVDEVQKNPFRMSDVVGAPAAPTGDPNAAGRAAAERARRDAELRRGKVQGALAQLKINGIIGGSNPVARISGEAVRVGDTIGDPPMFRVKAIHGRSIDLELASAAGDNAEVFELSMDDEISNTNAPKKKK